DVAALVREIDDPNVRAVALAERAVLRAFAGGCKVPVAVYGQLVDRITLYLEGLVAASDGSRVIRAQVEGSPNEPEELGAALWRRLVAAGADEILREVSRA